MTVFPIFTFPIIEYYKKAGFDFVGYTFEELANYFINKYQTASYEVNLYDNVILLAKYGYISFGNTGFSIAAFSI